MNIKAWLICLIFFAVGEVAAGQAVPQLQIEERIEFYDVAAKDRVTLMDSLHVPGTDPTRGVHGVTRAAFVIDRKFTQTPQQCVIDALAIRLELRVMLPRWAPGAALPSSLAREWVALRDRIAAHENRHRQNALDAAFAMREGFAAAAKKQNCVEVDKALTRVQVAALHKQQLMDRLLDQRPVLRK